MHDSRAPTDLRSYACSLSSSPESSGRGRSNFLQRLSSTLRDRSNRGYKKDENSSSAQARYILLSLVVQVNEQKGVACHKPALS